MKTRHIVPLLLLLLAFSSCWKMDNPLDPEINEQIATSSPTFYPAGGTYNNAQMVTIVCADSTATIRYSLDGSEPNNNSTLYSGAVPVSSNMTIKARAFKTGWPDSQTSTANYAFQTATPTFSPPWGGNVNVSISCATAGATIRYTTDGSEPTESSTEYTTQLFVSNQTLKAKAYKSGWPASQTATATYMVIPSNFVFVSGGTFNNGTSNVTLSSFYIDKYEITQAGYHAVIGTNPSQFTGVTNGPVENVSWFNAIEYCNLRSIQEGCTPCYSYSTYGTNPDNWPSGWNTSNTNHPNVSCNWTANGYRLPTEMEWMFAARGGNQTHNYTYSGSNDLNAVGWYRDNSGSTTRTVGTKASNELGTFDMSGNVWEWVWDIYGSYPSGAQTDPHGATSGSARVIRGGSWYYDASVCTVSYRNGSYASSTYSFVGFRCVRISP